MTGRTTLYCYVLDFDVILFFGVPGSFHPSKERDKKRASNVKIED